MIAPLLIGAAVVIAILLAASARLPSLVSTLLVAYLALVANVGLVTWALSPLHAVTRGGLAITETVLLAGAFATWWRRGRPRPPLAAARRTAAEVVREPATALFLALVASLLGYELLLALTAPANNWDSLTYHLARVAAWMDHGGIYEIPNAPSIRLNEYPPLAEQQILYLFVATGSGALFALPQYVAELAILVAVYGAARRLGFGARASVCSSCLFATFSFVVLQATTAQNDLFAASFPAVAAALVLGETRTEQALAGAAVGIGLGAKPTIALVLPALLFLALQRGRRAFGTALAGGAVGLAAIGVWVYVLNLASTGSVFGEGGWTKIGGSNQEPIKPTSFAKWVDVVYQTLDPSVLADRLIDVLALTGVVVAAVFALRRSVRAGLAVALPLLSPWLVIRAANGVAFLARSWGFPVRGPLGNVGEINHVVTGGAFGPVGAVTLLGAPLLTLGLYVLRRANAAQLALASALPIFFLLLSRAHYNWFLIRFLLVPAALTAPLFAPLFRYRAATAAYAVVGAIVAWSVLTQDPQRPLHSRFGRPWNLTQVQAIELSDLPEVGSALASYRRLVPEHACVGAVLGGEEPGYLLSGPRLRHHVFYLPVSNALTQAYKHFLFYVVISNGENRWAAKQFRGDGWRIRSLNGYWLLAVAPHAGDGVC